jgi:WD40 repeat protein
MRVTLPMLFLVIILIAFCTYQSEAVELTTKERSLGIISPGFIKESLTISHNCRRVAYITFKMNGKATVTLDGIESEEYEDIDCLTFSNDSKRFAYAGYMENRWYVIVDGIKHGGYEQLGSNTLKFSPNGKRLCYMVWEPSKNQQYVVVDGIKQIKYVGILKSYPIFSFNSEMIAYGAGEGSKDVLVINGEEDEVFDSIAGLVLSPDGQHYAYAGKQGKKWYLIFDGKKSKSGYDGMIKECTVFSPDSKRLIYAASNDGSHFAVVDGKDEKVYDVIDNGSIIFSPDSLRYAYRAIKGDKQCYVIDGKQEKLYDGVGGGTFVFSSDSKHFVYLASEKKKEFIVLDGRECKKYEAVTGAFFNPHNHKPIYSSKEDGGWFVVDGEKTGKKYEITDIPVISDDGSHTAYRAKISGNQIVICDGKEGRRYDEIHQSSLGFTANNNLIYLVRDNSQAFVVVDTVEGSKYDFILQYGEFSFSSASEFNFVALRGNEFLLVDVTLKQE